MTPAQKRTLEWLANGETGGSSKQLAFWLGFDVHYVSGNHPYDPADFDRCLRLLDLVPEMRPHLQRMSGISKGWNAIIRHWDEIEASHLAEVGLGWTKAKSAPKTYALMKRVLND